MPRKPNAVVYNPGPATVGGGLGRTFEPGWAPVLRDDPHVDRLVRLGQLSFADKPDPSAELDPGARAAWAAVDRKFAPAEPAPPATPPAAPPAPPTVPQED